MARLSEESRNTLREGERKMEEKFRAELSAQTRLANLYKCQSDEKTSKVDELSKVITHLRNMLEESAKKQENLIRNQNRAMIDQLENMGQQVSDITAAINVSVGEEPATNSQLRANIKYLRQEKDTIGGRLEVSQAETARLQSQLDHQQSLVTESQTNLELERSNIVKKLKSLKGLKENLLTKEKLITMLREDSDQHRKNGESYRFMLLEEKRKTRELMAENQKLKNIHGLYNNNDEEDRSEETPEATGQSSLKRARVSQIPAPVIKQEEWSEDEDSSSQQKKPKSEFFPDSE